MIVPIPIQILDGSIPDSYPQSDHVSPTKCWTNPPELAISPLLREVFEITSDFFASGQDAGIWRHKQMLEM